MIGRANLDGTGENPTFIVLGSRLGNPTGVAVDSSHIFWTDPENDKIGRSNLDGTGVNPSFITSGNYQYEIAVRGG